MAKDCRVPVYNIQEDVQEGYNDATEQWYGPQTTYDNHWWANDQTQVNAVQQPQQLAQPAPSQLDATPALQIAAVTAPRNSNSVIRAPDMSMIINLNKDELMIDSGAATHVCQIWFASTTQTYDRPEHERQISEQQQKTPLMSIGTSGSTRPTRATNRSLCVLGFTTNTAANKADRTRLHNPPQ